MKQEEPDQNRYARRGVASGKEDVHRAIAGLNQGLYAKAFCKILPDIVAGDPDYCNLMHADTAGTKTSLAYLYWQETGDLRVWEGIAQDALVMNIDDMACVGCTTGIAVSSTIARNKHLVPGEIIGVLIPWLETFCEEMRNWGVEIWPAGGETADVGDIVRTLDVGYATFARMRRKDVLVNDIRPGQVILGFASYGQSIYEQTYNSGIGSNGLTSARHDMLSDYYRTHYPASYAPETDPEVVYTGCYRLTDTITLSEGDYNVGQLLLSPTRTYVPLIHQMLQACRPAIKGMIHNTGGGLTKVGKFITEGCALKDNLLPTPPIFQLIKEQSGSPLREMWQVFNMGQRLECYVLPEAVDDILRMADELKIEAQVIGQVIPSSVPRVEVRHDGQTLNYNV
jgi:phosphoribosylformylglycinamidine cyclo-ligase